MNSPHPALRRLFDRLEQGGASWLLLRMPADLSSPTGDVDLLVAPDDVELLRSAAADVGFVPIPGWDAAPNLILVLYDRPSRCWLTLDVITDVSFRAPGFATVGGAARDVLARRQIRDGVAMPAEGDAFWLLLFHCLLDKSALAPRHRATLGELAPAAGSSPLGETILDGARDRMSASELATAVAGGRWEELETVGRRLVRRRSPHERLAGLRRAVRRPLLLRSRRGVGVALLGPNGVGKSTLASELRRSLPFDARVLQMGLWQAGPRGSRGSLDPLMRPLRVWRRYLEAQYHEARGRIVIFDRYVYEADLPAQPPLLALKRAYFWLLRHAVPGADVAVVLDAPAQLAYGRKRENTLDELKAERRFYAELADRLPSAHMVDASRDPESVCADTSAIVWDRLARRWGS